MKRSLIRNSRSGSAAAAVAVAAATATSDAGDVWNVSVDTKNALLRRD